MSSTGRTATSRTRVPFVVVLLALFLMAGCGTGDITADTASGTATPATDAVRTGSTATSSTSTSTTSTSTTSSAAPSTTAPPTTAPPTTGPPSTAPADPPPAPVPPTAPAAAPAPPLPAGPNSVFVLGDSVLLGTTYGTPAPMVAALPGWNVTLDCAGSRRLTQGIDVLAARRSEIGRVVVIQLGNNYIPGEGGTFAEQIDRTMAVLAGTDRVVWVTVGEALSGRAELNADIRAAAGRYPSIVVADWAPVVAADPSLAPGDGLHLSNQGRVVLSDLVASAVGPAPG